jgi:hypothetical protein
MRFFFQRLRQADLRKKLTNGLFPRERAVFASENTPHVLKPPGLKIFPANIFLTALQIDGYTPGA